MTDSQQSAASPVPLRAYDPRTASWVEIITGTAHSSETSDSKFSIFTYESRSTTPDSVSLDLRRDVRDENRGRAVSPAGADVNLVSGGVGRLPDEVYSRTLSWWRAAVRRRLVKNVEWESEVLAAMQAKIRTPFLDAYFVYTSSLGTHTFFMTVLPAFFFFGYQEEGRGLLFVLAFGVYVSSFAKDLFCAPRPFAPPVARMTIGSHHLEYGFPSTHSTNSMSIALYFFSLIYRVYTTPVHQASEALGNVNGAAQETMISDTTFYAATSLLLFYIFSIVFGRLYTAMHSFTDCIFGVLLGTGVWALHSWCGALVDAWVQESGWIVPTVIIPLSLLLVNRHPQPVDDCPCFEDAIAFVSVILGEMLMRWFMCRYGLYSTFFVTAMPGKAVGTWADMGTWWGVAASKMVVGVLAIFAWRIFAKFLLHRMLPPIFRFLSQLVTLPHRRFYTPATDYTNVPQQERGLRAIPSVIDLPGMVEMEVDGVGASTARARARSARGGRSERESGIKLRGARGKGEKVGVVGREKGAGLGLGLEEMGGKQADVDVVKHYDADVLTKVFVYCGIGAVASGIMPVVFELLGWGVR